MTVRHGAQAAPGAQARGRVGARCSGRQALPLGAAYCGPMTEAVATSSSKSASETLPETA